ncbi:protein of unknown function [Candidatus Filomicrobium marinum]|uniref:Uncharacterized protein n=1 Tax=Candidatus Filomicrobium marinum TaxID=1608628 RepID=A0A0D6J9E6_9HYPH|nr:protein of unknown function [Candidatus Filomicrobium marinum]CPR14717.1 protein of unknown function [Candidatus Filomicrobium marinum]
MISRKKESLLSTIIAYALGVEITASAERAIKLCASDTYTRLGHKYRTVATTQPTVVTTLGFVAPKIRLIPLKDHNAQAYRNPKSAQAHSPLGGWVFGLFRGSLG